MQRRTTLMALRAAALGLIVLVLWHDLLAALDQTVSWPADFASYFVPAKVVSIASRTNVYDYGLLLRLNALHHFVTAPASYTAPAFYPFIYPPFTLILLRPLTGLDFASANAIWITLSHAFAIASAFLLADAFTYVLRLRATSKLPSRIAVTTSALLDATALPFGRWRFPLLPFAVASAVILFAWPAYDTYFFGQINFFVLFLLALALHAHLHRRPVLAGFAVAAAGALKLTPLFFLAYFIARRSWKALIAGIVFSVLFAALPLLALPEQDYHTFLVELQVLDPTFTGAAHNESFVGVFIHLAALFGAATAPSVTTVTSSTTTTVTSVPGEVIGEILAALLGTLTLIGLFLAGLPQSSGPGMLNRLRAALRSDDARSTDADQPAALDALTLDWLGFALILAAYMLVTPLVWSHYYVVALPAALLLGTLPLVRRHPARQGPEESGGGLSRGDALAVYAAFTALALLMVELPDKIDRGDPGISGVLRFLLVSSRAAGMLLLWAALGVLLLRLWRRAPAPHPELPSEQLSDLGLASRQPMAAETPSGQPSESLC